MNTRMISRCLLQANESPREWMHWIFNLEPVGDGVGKTPGGDQVGVIVCVCMNGITGLEIYDPGTIETSHDLPVPDTIVPWDRVEFEFHENRFEDSPFCQA